MEITPAGGSNGISEEVLDSVFAKVAGKLDESPRNGNVIHDVLSVIDDKDLLLGSTHKSFLVDVGLLKEVGDGAWTVDENA